jgi:hypothetical protein
MRVVDWTEMFVVEISHATDRAAAFNKESMRIAGRELVTTSPKQTVRPITIDVSIPALAVTPGARPAIFRVFGTGFGLGPRFTKNAISLLDFSPRNRPLERRRY